MASVGRPRAFGSDPSTGSGRARGSLHSEWLAFQHKAFRAFPNLEFNFQLSDEEAEESVSEAEANSGTEVLYEAPDRAPLPDDLLVPLEASSLALPAGVLPSNPLLL